MSHEVNLAVSNPASSVSLSNWASALCNACMESNGAVAVGSQPCDAWEGGGGAAQANWRISLTVTCGLHRCRKASQTQGEIARTLFSKELVTSLLHSLEGVYHMCDWVAWLMRDGNASR